MNTPLRRQPIGLLLVEDSPADSRLLSESLREVPGAEDAVIRTVRTLAEAQAELARFSFTCVLLDLGLPDGRGIGNIEVLRGIDRSVAIVVLTGNDDERLAAEAIRLGAQDYLVKGQFDASKIVRLIRHAIQRNRHVHELEDDRHREFHRASHDGLTGLANRALFHDRLGRMLEQAKAGGTPFALCNLDLDGFKAVNDRHGHPVGDELLVQVATVLLESITQADSVARVGGDEFLVLLNLPEGADDPGDTAHRLRDRIMAIRQLGEHAIDIAASVGIVVYPEHGDTSSLLLERADQAMYEAKRAGSGIAFYSQGVSANPEHQVDLRSSLHEILIGNRFSLLYHPWVDAESGRFFGLKLAVRWDQFAGVEQAEEFLRAVAAAGCAGELGLHVASRVLQQWKQWCDLGLDLPPLVLRLREAELEDEHFLPALRALADGMGIAPDTIRLLIATTGFSGLRAQRALVQLLSARAEGFGVVLDGFSADAEAFKWLTTIPLDGVRLAPGVLCALNDEGSGGSTHRFLSVLRAGAAAIEVPVIVTGVENVLECRRLQALGYRYLQGSLFGPLSAAAVQKRLSMAPDALSADQ